MTKTENQLNHPLLHNMRHPINWALSITIHNCGWLIMISHIEKKQKKIYYSRAFSLHLKLQYLLESLINYFVIISIPMTIPRYCFSRKYRDKRWKLSIKLPWCPAAKNKFPFVSCSLAYIHPIYIYIYIYIYILTI